MGHMPKEAVASARKQVATILEDYVKRHAFFGWYPKKVLEDFLANIPSSETLVTGRDLIDHMAKTLLENHTYSW